jgi:hypothetical protein
MSKKKEYKKFLKSIETMPRWINIFRRATEHSGRIIFPEKYPYSLKSDSGNNEK